MTTQKFLHVPYAKSIHGEEEIAAVVNVLRSSTQMGKCVSEMEAKVSALFSKKYGIMVNSGTSANYLAVEILNLPPNSEIITPVLTFATTVAPIIRHHLIPAFVDVDLDTYNIDVKQVEAMITPATKAMMIPNLLGNLPDWQTLRAIADAHHLTIIEDSADTLGATIGNASSGQFTDLSTTSFYGSHVVNCAGNGGMLCVNDENLAKSARLLRSWGRTSSLFTESEAIDKRFNIKIDDIDYDAKFVFSTIGYNLEPSEMGAAFGLVQLKNLKNNITKREEIVITHQAFFNDYQDYFILPKQLSNSQTAWLAFPLIVKDSAPFTRKALQIFLETRNIQTRTIFTGNILRQPGFNQIKRKTSKQGYPHADQVMRGGMLIGCHHGLTPEMMAHLYQSFSEFLKQLKHSK